MLVDIDLQLVFPPAIINIVLWSPSVKRVLIIELTVLWEDSLEEAYERKYK